jgi:hypothetical protein
MARLQVTANLDDSYADRAQLTVIGGSSHNLAAARNASAHELGGDGPGGILGDGLGANAVPALGNSWHHCVSTRLVLDHLTSSKRALTVTKSPISALVTCGFAITAAGLEEDDQGPADSCSASGRVAGGAF